jgi:hypothetical protein
VLICYIVYCLLLFFVCSSTVRSFRHAATLTAAQLVSSWITVSAGLTKSRELAKFQLDAEEKKKAKVRAASLWYFFEVLWPFMFGCCPYPWQCAVARLQQLCAVQVCHVLAKRRVVVMGLTKRCVTCGYKLCPYFGDWLPCL